MILQYLGLDLVHFLQIGDGVELEVDRGQAEVCLGVADASVELEWVAGNKVVGKPQGAEHEARGSVVETPAADPGDDFGESALDGGAVLKSGEVEHGWSGFSSAGAGTAAGGVVVVAELFAAEGGRAAGLAVG